jgi:NADPH:quinone reductase-like Zn-dependent oxidoreductase
MPPQNRAAWLKKKQDKIQVVEDAPYHNPEANELVIRTMAVAINPADVVVQKLGIIVDTYPAILGCDVAGIVEEVGANIEDFKVGDRVIGTAQPRPGGIFKYSGFQQYVVLKMPQVARIPDSTSFTDGTVLPLGILASSSCLFHEETLDLEMPPSQNGNGKIVLIWGASSSLGCCGVQLAAAAGYEVFAVASTKNHGLVKSLGAVQAFDQNHSNVVDNVVSALKGKVCVGAFDAISKEETLHALCDILSKSDARPFVAAISPEAESFAKNEVTVKSNLSCTKPITSISQQIWRVFLEPALASGTVQCAPPADIVGQGLEDVQKCCDVLAQGVSAKKVVLEL